MATICGLYACEEEKKITTNLYQAVPANSVIVAEVNNAATLEKAYLNNSANQILRATPYFKSLESQLSLFTSALSSESLNSFFKERKLLISYMLSGAQKYNALLITTANAKFENDLGNALSAKFTAGSQSYSGAKIFSFAHTSGQTLYVCSQNGLLLISLEKNLIEAGLRQSKSELGLASNADFKKLLKTRNVKDLANVFVNLQELPALAKTHLPEGETQFLKHLGSWAELDLQSTAHEIVGSGLLTYPQNEAFFTRVFQKVRAHESAAAQIIPANFSIWVNYNVGNIGEYQRAYSKYLEQKGELTAYQDLLQKLPPNAPALMEAWVDNEMGIFKAGRSEELSHTFAYLRHRGNAEEATQSLAPFADSTYVEGYRGFVIKKMAAQNTLPRLYGSLFSSLHYPYFTLTENYVIFASNLPALKALLNDILANKTLVNESSYQSFTNQLPGNSHIMVWAANPQFLSLISELAPAFKSTEKALADSLQNLKWAALQIKAADEGAFINGILLHEKPVEEKVSRLWNTQLPHPLKGEPQLLRNHSTKKYDVAIADEKNNLYLLSKEGKVFWNKALDGPIIGDIRQIDIFKNNKLQMVFNTANSLYVVDRLGRDVTGFPVNLPQKATAPVGVFNYDQARNYRLVVPAGPQLLNYNVQGKPVKGWVFKEASSPIISEPQHFTVARQDVIVCLTANGKLYQLNRRGEERFTVDEKIEELKTSFYLREGKSLKTSELIAGSNSGKMYVINPQDKIDALYLDETKPADHLIYFDNRYIFTYDEELIVKDPNQPFTVSLKDDISIKPKALVLNNKFYVGAFSAAAEEIRVFNQQGDLLDGFPIFAQGPFDMGSLEQNGKLNLISYAEDGTLICYLVR
jgi:hypothetical protein